ncbi:385_t:CDS:10 [Funneliformis geosporum]|uniref:385_t:CDS:1 n=1 Tax=Funneliformis geosporum TaxID=1117311 RepID=A0A9W4SL08_9GLOM|nr:385_t:CDS:10 [Funneliformis geosporum]
MPFSVTTNPRWQTRNQNEKEGGQTRNQGRKGRKDTSRAKIQGRCNAIQINWIVLTSLIGATTFMGAFVQLIFIPNTTEKSSIELLKKNFSDMKTTSHWTKDHNTTRNQLKERQNISNLSRTIGKSRVEKANLPTPMSFCNNKVSRNCLQIPMKHNIKATTKHESKKHGIKASLEQANGDQTEILNEMNTIEKNSNHREIMSELTATMKKREIQISKSMDEQFESSKMTITEFLSVYLEKEDNFINKIACDYKDKMDEYADERLNCLRKLRFGFEKYQLTASTLLETLENNHSQKMRTRRDFDKDIERMRSIHQLEIKQLCKKIEEFSESFHKTMSIIAKETQRKPFANELKSILKL